ncbi:MAG: hypothetical protein QXQ14_01785 [Candidatus Aenigmatarchaeota archaeon]
MEIPLRPLGKKDVHQLESILLIATIFRPEVIELIKNPEERLTWVDSLAVAAAAVAREKAGMTVSQIVEELGRTEQTIRKHLKGESKAGQLVRETYELIKQGKLNEILSYIEKLYSKEGIQTETKELEEYKLKVEKLEKENAELKRVIEKIKKELESLTI